MARRYRKSADSRSVAIDALERGLLRRNARVAFADLLGYLLAVTRTGAARLKRNVRVLHLSHVRVLRDPDVTDGTVLVRVVLVRMIEFERISRRNRRVHMRRRKPVAARTIGARRLYTLIMTRETRRVRIGIVLKELGLWRKRLGRSISQRLHRGRKTWRGLRQRGGRLVTDRTVIELGQIVSHKARLHKVAGGVICLLLQSRDQILMHVVRKDRVELLRTRPHWEREPRDAPRPRRDVTTRAERRSIADQDTPQAVTVKARGVAGKVGDVRILSRRRPVCRGDLMA